MQAFEFLSQVRNKSIKMLTDQLTDNEQVASSYVDKLEIYFDVLQQAVYVGDPQSTIPMIDELLRIESAGNEASLLNINHQFFTQIIQTASEDLVADGFTELVTALLPFFSFSNQYIYAREVDSSISKVAEELHQEKTSLERLEQSKSDFISIAAHELKTPLTLITGYSAMLREIIKQKKIYDEHILSLLDGMDSGSRRLREIINDMIDVSQIDNNMLALNFQPTWIYKILDRINEEVKDVLESRNLTLVINRFSGDDVMYFYDSERLYQAVYNVISNAIKYTPDGGKIVIEGRSSRDMLELVIIDNGIGIDQVDQTKIFDKLQPIGDTSFHSSGKIKFKGGGPGLGLPIAKGIIEAHGGRIWVESDGYDEIACPGSTFRILLPQISEPPDKDASKFFGALMINKSGQDS